LLVYLPAQKSIESDSALPRVCISCEAFQFRSDAALPTHVPNDTAFRATSMPAAPHDQARALVPAAVAPRHVGGSDVPQRGSLQPPSTTPVARGHFQVESSSSSAAAPSFMTGTQKLAIDATRKKDLTSATSSALPAAPTNPALKRKFVPPFAREGGSTSSVSGGLVGPAFLKYV
jgi:hypothetical protein